MKKIISLLIALASFSISASAATYSEWAKESIETAYLGGIIREDSPNNDFTKPANREEIAKLMVLAYENVTGEKADLTPVHFEDTADGSYAAGAYRLGIMNGTGDVTFSPEEYVTREQLAKILVSLKAASEGKKIVLSSEDSVDCADYAIVSDWAKPYVALAYNEGIINGFEDGSFRPGNTASGEEVISLICRTVKIKKVLTNVIKPILNSVPTPESEIKIDEMSGDFVEPKYVRIKWNEGAALVYAVKVTESRNSYYEGDIAPKTVYEYDIRRENYFDIELNANRNYTVEINGGGIEIKKEFRTYTIHNDDTESIKNNYPQTKEAAEALVTTVTVPVWRLSGNEKISGEANITVHKAIAEKVKLVFEEIYNGDEKFPIKDVGGYAWRGGRSEHNGGTAIDINWDENYCIYENGTTIGSYWKPYEDPYSITPYGDVVNAFEKYGFTWGGDAWRNPKDYMHFSYLGT